MYHRSGNQFLFRYIRDKLKSGQRGMTKSVMPDIDNGSYRLSRVESINKFGSMLIYPRHMVRGINKIIENLFGLPNSLYALSMTINYNTMSRKKLNFTLIICNEFLHRQQVMLEGTQITLLNNNPLERVVLPV